MQAIADGQCGVAVLAHFPNLGPTTTVHRNWLDFRLVLDRSVEIRLHRLNRRAIRWIELDQGAHLVTCAAIDPVVGAQFFLSPGTSAVVAVTPASSLSERSGELVVTVYDSKGRVVSSQRGIYES
jgi:hypothetical protein